MKVPTSISNYLPEVLQKAGEEAQSITGFHPVSGGSINQAYRVETPQKDFFVKINNASRFPGMFEAEAKGLDLLRRGGTFKIPKVLAVEGIDNQSFILMDYIRPGTADDQSWDHFAHSLAAQHGIAQKLFGLDQDNYMGSLQQVNRQENSWEDFFALHRLEPQLRLAQAYFSHRERQRFEKLMAKLSELVPACAPALLHGDLWSGNYLMNDAAKPALIDPAVYFGHPETDLAMMHLFGGFPPEIFSTYEEIFPLEKDWRERIGIHNLYPLLVHVNLFGESYTAQVRRILERFA